jgi:methylated-DNA-[protein]-cysteine S-methyltransferase
MPILLEGFSRFARRVLAACRQIRLGEVVTYSGLARKTGRQAAARAVGNALAKNPLPLIIPCHRVIRSDGRIGGFSGPGGATMKKRLLELERPNRG